MNGLPFIYTPRPGEWIAIGRGADGGSVAVTVHKQGSERTVAIPAAEAPWFAGQAAEAVREAAEDPAEVEELARALHEDRERNDGEPGEWDRQSARAALRWMNGRQQRGESRDA